MIDDEDDLQRIDSHYRQQRLVWFLSLAWLVPFLLPAILVWVLGIANPLSEPMIAIFRNYSVITLSFLGGIRWGHSLLQSQDEVSPIDLYSIPFSVIPAMLAWATMFLDTTLALSILLIAYCAHGAWDSISAQLNKLPAWFALVRMYLTGVVAIAHAALILAIA